MASIQEVSQAAGVSIATVSRVINRSSLVSPQTKAIVHRAIRDLGYVPPPIEKRQRRSTGRPVGARKGNVALLFPDTRADALRTSLSRRLTQGVGELLSSKEISLMVAALDADSLVPECVREKQVDGVIIRGNGNALALSAALKDTPCVWLLELGEEPSRGDHAFEDNEAIGRMAANYLLKHGHRHVACINPEGQHPAYRARCDAFARTAARQGAMCSRFIEDNLEAPLWQTAVWQPQIVRLVDQLRDSIHRDGSNLVKENAPTGLFIPLPDDMVLFAREYIAQRGLLARGADSGGGGVELVVCTYDPLRMSALADAPPQIDIHAEAIGRAAAELLLWRLRNPREPQRRVAVAPTLIESRRFDFKL